MTTINDAQDLFGPFRRALYPRLHTVLQEFGGYSIGACGAQQYVCTLHATEHEAEEVLKSLGYRYNPVAALKYRDTGDISAGSWALWEDGLLRSDFQTHVTLFHNRNWPGYVDVYAHREYSWARHPRKHLRADHMEFPTGEVFRSLLPHSPMSLSTDKMGLITECGECPPDRAVPA